MEPPYEEQYSQEGNPSAYMTMRDYRNLPYQWQQHVERNPSEYRSMRDYRDQWMSSPYGSTYNHSWGNHTNSSWEPRPPQYAHPEPPFYASTPQSPQSPQLPQSIPPFEQAILDLTWIVDDFVEENKEINAHSIVTVEDNLNKKIDGLKDDFEHKLDILQESISKLTNQFVHQEEENLEEECLTETILVEQDKLHPKEELKVESAEAPEELQDALESSVAFWPWRKEEEITTLLTEKSSGHETVEGTQEPIIQPNPIDLDPNATAQPKNNPLLVPPSADQVYILPTPAKKSKPASPAPKGKSNPSLHVMQNIKELVAIAQAFATTSKKMATAYIAWHSGWFGCGFGFGAPGPRHF